MKKNMSRRHFLKMGGLALAAMSVRPSLSFAAFRESETKFVSLRPSIDKRRFVSRAVEVIIKEVKPKIKMKNCGGCLKIVFPIHLILLSDIR